MILDNRQDAFYENYFESQRDHIFRSVELLIYVFDIESTEMEVGCSDCIKILNAIIRKICFILMDVLRLFSKTQVMQKYLC